MRWFDDVRFGAAAAMFMVEGMCQGPLGANWGDGFAHSSDAVNILTQSGIPQGDPNPFFQKLMVRSLKMIESTSAHYILSIIFLPRYLGQEKPYYSRL